MISGVDFVCVPSADFERAAAFYGGVLGLECSRRYDRVPGGEFETGNLTLQVIDAAAVGMEMRPSGTPIALHVDDFAGARAELEARGVTFDADAINSGVCLMAPFRDPDGNRLLLHHRYAPRTG